MRTFFTLPLLLALAAPAVASSPAAWAALDRQAAAACKRESGLRAPVVLGKRTGFPDDVGYEALLVRGALRRGTQQVTMLCLYRRGQGRAVVTEAPGWSAR